MTESLRSSLPRSRPNYLYSIVSVALVLFLLGFFGLLLLHARQLLHFYQENVNLIMEFKDTATPVEIDSLRAELGKKPYVLPESVRYISQEEAATMMRKEFGEEFLSLNLPNPFYDIVTFNIQAGYMNPDSLKSIRSAWREVPAVSDVYYQENLLSTIARNMRQVGFILLGLGLFLTLIVGVLIHNTIRLALYANRFLIKTMELVGASWSFISRPYLRRAVFHGFLSGMIASIGLSGLLAFIQQKLPEVVILTDIRLIAALLAALLFLGILIYVASTWYVVNRYLRMRMDDLY